MAVTSAKPGVIVRVRSTRRLGRSPWKIGSVHRAWKPILSLLIHPEEVALSKQEMVKATLSPFLLLQILTILLFIRHLRHLMSIHLKRLLISSLLL